MNPNTLTYVPTPLHSLFCCLSREFLARKIFEEALGLYLITFKLMFYKGFTKYNTIGAIECIERQWFIYKLGIILKNQIQ